MLKFSIIVPIYNVEPYLCKCIDSLLNQDIPSDEYEIILVDDGSTDGCVNIVNNYSCRYDNIVAIHQSNGGLSAARNCGIDNAKGEYVIFVDSDDYLQPNVLKELISVLSLYRLDVLRYRWQCVDEEYSVVWPYKSVIEDRLYTHPVCDGKTFLNEYATTTCYAIQYAVKTSILKMPENHFTSGILMEDTEWMARMLISAKAVYSINFIAYNYLQRKGSICNAMTSDARDRIFNNKFIILESLIKQKSVNPDVIWYNKMITSIVLTIFNDLTIWYYDNKVSVINLLKHKYNIFPLAIFNSRACIRIKLCLINKAPVLYCSIFHLLSKYSHISR